MSHIKSFKAIGRYFFDELIKKWLFLIILSLFIYSFMAFTQNPLSRVWELNYGQDCPNYMWQIWFLFRNLQLDCKACLPWLSLLSSEILFTILAAPFIIIYRVRKSLAHALFGVIIFISIMVSYAILED